MVLYKRKPIILPNPKQLPIDLDINVWHIDETGEWFLSYQEYLDRIDFYTRHRFTCEITGTSCLTFFEALDSEETQFKYVEEKFPLKLREPVARFLHFNTIRRLDLLVEKVYGSFKNDFFPGETVYLRRPKEVSGSTSAPNSATPSKQNTPQPPDLINDPRQPHFQTPYIIKEKVQFNPTINPVTKEIIIPGHSKYMLIETDAYNNISVSSKSFIADQTQIYRDRSTFTKHLIKCFFKITLQKASTKMGAPWCVKPEYLQMYGLTMDWPKELLEYKDDDVSLLKETKKERQRKKQKNIKEFPFAAVFPNEDGTEGYNHTRKKKKESNKRKNISPSNESTDTNDNRSADDGENKKIKKQKTSDEDLIESGIQSKASSVVPDASAQMNITTITNDLEIPYKERPTIFLSQLSYYNELMECIPLAEEKSPSKTTINNFDRLLQIYQFVCTFQEKLCISSFNFDEFVTSLRCTDPSELKGEIVYVTLSNSRKGQTDQDDEEEEEEEETESNWQRNFKIRNFISDKHAANEDINYKIVKDDPASDDAIDNLNSNGTGLIIEIFVSLLRLFIDEDGNWVTIIMEDWMVSSTVKKNTSLEEANEKGNIKNESVIDKESNETEEPENYASDQSSEEDDFDEKLDKCLNFRNSNWAEKLTKRQFKNNNWLMILLGVFQDSAIIPKYTNFIKTFTEKIIPDQVAANQLPKLLWRNFCRNFSLYEKITCLWILVDIVSNFSPDIKTSIEESMELCTLIRSERYRVSKELKVESTELSSIDQEKTPTEYEEKQNTVNTLQNDKNILDKKLMENDYQRLKLLGRDRYCNSYFWFDLTGVKCCQLSDENHSYHSGRIWIQGPNEYYCTKYLEITRDELNSWLTLAKAKGNRVATKEIFNIYETGTGSYNFIDAINNAEVELVSSEGVINTSINLSPIQRKIIDETPDCLLLDCEKWYCIDNFEDLKAIVEWFDTWGRREHDLLRQIKPVLDAIETSMTIRSSFIDSDNLRRKEAQYFDSLSDTKLNSSEINLNSHEGTQNTNENPVGKEEIEEIEEDLESIAAKILELDDSSKTRKVLTEIEELEKQRNSLLEKKERLLKSETPGSRIMVRTEQKRNKRTRDNKLARKTELLTDLLNYRHFNNMEVVNSWKNQLALSSYGSELRKNASKGKKYNTKHTIDSTEEKFKKIVDATSKRSHVESV